MAKNSFQQTLQPLVKVHNVKPPVLAHQRHKAMQKKDQRYFMDVTVVCGLVDTMAETTPGVNSRSQARDGKQTIFDKRLTGVMHLMMPGWLLCGCRE